MKLSDKHTFNISINQKKTLTLLHEKYKINTSKFIRDAINDKLTREKNSIFKNYKEIKNYINKLDKCPF
jgi:hypothetical protein